MRRPTTPDSPIRTVWTSRICSIATSRAKSMAKRIILRRPSTRISIVSNAPTCWQYKTVSVRRNRQPMVRAKTRSVQMAMASKRVECERIRMVKSSIKTGAENRRRPTVTSITRPCRTTTKINRNRPKRPTSKFPAAIKSMANRCCAPGVCASIAHRTRMSSSINWMQKSENVINRRRRRWQLIWARATMHQRNPYWRMCNHCHDWHR